MPSIGLNTFSTVVGLLRLATDSAGLDNARPRTASLDRRGGVDVFGVWATGSFMGKVASVVSIRVFCFGVGDRPWVVVHLRAAVTACDMDMFWELLAAT